MLQFLRNTSGKVDLEEVIQPWLQFLIFIIISLIIISALYLLMKEMHKLMALTDAAIVARGIAGAISAVASIPDNVVFCYFIPDQFDYKIMISDYVYVTQLGPKEVIDGLAPLPIPVNKTEFFSYKNKENLIYIKKVRSGHEERMFVHYTKKPDVSKCWELFVGKGSYEEYCKYHDCSKGELSLELELGITDWFDDDLNHICENPANRDEDYIEAIVNFKACTQDLSECDIHKLNLGTTNDRTPYLKTNTEFKFYRYNIFLPWEKSRVVLRDVIIKNLKIPPIWEGDANFEDWLLKYIKIKYTVSVYNSKNVRIGAYTRCYIANQQFPFQFGDEFKCNPGKTKFIKGNPPAQEKRFSFMLAEMC
jgi:hypothetical protein